MATIHLRIFIVVISTFSLLPKLGQAVISGTCQDENSVESDGKCFQFITGLVTWSDAKGKCASKGMALAKVTPAQLPAVIKDEYETWIGANDIDNEQAYIWDYDQSSATADLESFQEWSHASESSQEYDCVMAYSIDGLRLSEQDCSYTAKAFICMEIPCENKDSIKSQGTCFKYITTEVTWSQAKEECASLNMALAKVKSETQIRAFLPLGKYSWIGANDIDKEGAYIWYNDQSSATTDLESFEGWQYGGVIPSNYDCVMAGNTRVIEIFEYDCEVKKNYVCVEIQPITSTIEPTTSTEQTTTTEPTTTTTEPTTTTAEPTTTTAEPTTSTSEPTTTTNEPTTTTTETATTSTKPTTPLRTNITEPTTTQTKEGCCGASAVTETLIVCVVLTLVAMLFKQH